MTLSEAEMQAFRAFEKSGWELAADPYHHHWGRLSSQSAGAMLDAARVAQKSRVLDIATGAGYVAAAAAERGAIATGIDFSGGQIELARRTFPDVEFEQASAEKLPFEAGTFDAVVMGFGMNHLPDPEAAILEARRVLKSGGCFAFTVWAAPRSGEGFGIVLSAIEHHGVAVNLPPAPPYFRFADPEEVSRTLIRSGFLEPATRIVPQHWEHETPDLVFDAFNEGAVRATAMLKAQPPEAREAIRSAVRADVKHLEQDGMYVIQVPAALSSAQKP